MRLTWRDGVATLMGAFAAAIVIATTNAWAWPGLASYRTGTLVLGAIGLGMCIVGSQLADDGSAPKVTSLPGLLGFGGAVLTISGIITGSKVIFLALAVDMAVLYAMATVRHALGTTSATAHPHGV
jgi:hypothetical protein